ncbi:cereblon family protein [Spirochaetota bacterium]
MIGMINNISLEWAYPTIATFKQTETADTIVVEPEIEMEENYEKEHVIICKFCQNIITSPQNIIEINGQHSHTYKNPAGHIFTIGCFKEAAGCKVFEEPTLEYTWFSGFTWCFAICSNCNSHLGWFYESGDNKFYGLILKNLIDNSGL